MDQGTSSPAIEEQQTLQNNLNKFRCQQPVPPTVANAQINYLNKQMQIHSNGLQSLNKQIADLESRYMIQFTAGNANNFLSQANNVKGGLTISGSIPNPQLNFTLIPPLQGVPGPRGPAGQQGPSGFPGIQGGQGPQGYWGIQGNGK